MVLKLDILRIFAILMIVVNVFGITSAVTFAEAAETIPATKPIVSANGQNKNTYSAYLSQFEKSDYSSENIVYELNGAVLRSEPIEFEIEVQRAALYGIGMSYKALDVQMSSVKVGVQVDGLYPYTNMKSLDFPRMWMDEDGEVRTDDLGNEFAAQQVLYDDYYYNAAMDEAVECNERFMVHLSEGVHKICIIPVSGEIELEYFKFYSVSQIKGYSSPQNSKEYYKGESVVIEGESAKAKSSYFLIDKNDSSSMKVSPQNAAKSLMNYIGGGNWKTVGETVVWETPEMEAGYYQLGFSYRQNSNIGGKSYRLLKIDGETPFAEAEKVGFSYGDEWQEQFFADDKNKPYLIYLSAGVHEISLTVTAADVTQVRTLLTGAVAALGDLYVDITKITGETVDIYRDYDLFSQIGDMEERLNDIRDSLVEAGDTLLSITGEKSGSNYSVIMNMVQTIEQMLDNRYEAHRYKSTYYTNFCSVSSVLQELRVMPLDIDKIVFTSVGQEAPFEKTGFFEQMIFSLKRFMVSFSKNYNAVSLEGTNNSSITIWVNWGRDQAQVLNSLIKRSFEPKTDIKVNLKLVNASVVQAVLSGSGPDCFLQMTRSEPVNLAMRGVLYDLATFDDCEKVLNNFQPGAEIPYRYNGGLYALPDTQNFYMMFYREDILNEYGLEAPETWEDFDFIAKLLMRNNMSVYLPITPATDVAQANMGVGSNNIFPSLLLQNGVSLYSEDGKQTNLLSSDAMEIFDKWVGYYTELRFPVSLDFYNRFRTGTTPLGIATYTQYTTFKAAAPEIDGLWKIAAVPGTAKEDGSISRASSGGGTGCVILKDSKNPQAAWEFLKWWTSTDTQLTYSNDLESVLGPSGRVALANVEALKGLSWESDELEQVLYAWENVEEIPEYPGSYYVSRSVYQAYWNVVNFKKNSKEMLMKYAKEADSEISRKWEQYNNR